MSHIVKSFLRRVEHQSVPLALDVIVFRLLSDIKTIKLQLPAELLLSLEDDQRDLKGSEKTGQIVKSTDKNRDVIFDLCEALRVLCTLRQLYPMMQRKEMMVWTIPKKAMAGSM